MEDKCCTKCGSEFMIMENLTLCPICKSNTLKKKTPVHKFSDDAGEDFSLNDPRAFMTTNQRFRHDNKRWWEFWK